MIIAKSLYRVLRRAIGRMFSEDGGPFFGIGAILASSSSSGIEFVQHSLIKSRGEVQSKSGLAR